ncbi:MAG: Hsp20/alpha crystallin family protein [Myxococcota bacterium]
MSFEGWDPFEDLMALREKMNLLFERSLERSRNELSSPGVISMNMNLWDTGEAYLIFAELPGVTLADVEVSVVGDHLTIRGAKKRKVDAESTSFIRIERNAGNFSRRFVLPDPVDPKKVDAKLKNGVLKIVIPKENIEKKVIPVKGG